MADDTKMMMVDLDDLTDLMRVLKYYTEVLEESYNTIVTAQKKLDDLIKKSSERIEVPADKDFGIEKLNLCARTYNAMIRGRIYRISDVLNFPRDRFFLLKNFGKSSERELEAAMHKLGYQDFIISYSPSKNIP